ncbi:DUF3558 family protein [Amycolatopsis sp., V23-08]|uniref:DUF3558 family protein n=1 Tax=Amycolatopsis heterodermiae TaxID=3110235 RepID=A0ABU5R5V4_9PSEU|nr:DUF3558 family protein [Amycolatopsis sp., V23-08]MEA5361606.1 DUF3558 family protein [Amycolatopsis sp., V23-08]
MTKLFVRVVLPLVAGGALLAGCTSTQGGTASPAQSPSAGDSSAPETSASAGGGGTESISDPCTLIEAGDLSSYGEFNPPVSKKLGTARSCSYQKKIASASDESIVVGANVRDDASIDQVNDTGGGVVDKDVNGRKAREASGGSVAACTLGLAVGASRVDVVVTTVSSADQACQIAEAVAKAVEPRLPKG